MLKINSIYTLLSQKGKVIWNKWARRYIDEKTIKALPITEDKKNEILNIDPISDEDLSVILGINEEDIEKVFGDHIEFPGSTLDERNFSEYIFPLRTIFEENISFNENTHFVNTIFFKRVDFVKATFPGTTFFSSSVFLDSCVFQGCTFQGSAEFDECIIKNMTWIKGSVFNGYASFKNTAFDDLNISDCEFTSSFNIINAHINNKSNFNSTRFIGGSNFNRAVFLNKVDFTNADFNSETLFIGTVFGSVPIFNNTTMHQSMSFYSALFPEITNDEFDMIGWRTLKLKMHELHNYEQELLFFSNELATKKEIHWKNRKYFSVIPLELYEITSSYGRSIYKPLILLIMSILLFSLIYNSCIWDSNISFSYAEGLQFSLANMFPFTITSKNIIANYTDLAHIGVDLQITTIIQNILSIIFMFLIGLGVRNTLKI